jgi:hypothetical protein
MSKKSCHSKYKNTGILFELLVRQITADILNNKNSSIANKLLQKYFYESKPLGKELKLYQIFLNEKVKNSEKANLLFEAVLKSRKKISNTSLATEKFNLVKEIKENYNINDFFRTSLPNYKTLASIYKILEDHINENYDIDAKELFQSKNHLMEVITGKVLDSKNPEKLNGEIDYYLEQDKDIRMFSYKLLIDSFNTKYSQALDEKQRLLLKEYINNVSNTNSLRNYVDKELPSIKSQLKSHIDKTKDSVLKIKLTEVFNQLEKISIGKIVKDNQILSMMYSYELIKELDNV